LFIKRKKTLENQPHKANLKLKIKIVVVGNLMNVRDKRLKRLIDKKRLVQLIKLRKSDGNSKFILKIKKVENRITIILIINMLIIRIIVILFSTLKFNKIGQNKLNKVVILG
jgi:hypothetical protein